MNFTIIGGGASGLACAITLKRLVPEADVKILEKDTAAGKKISVTGNGRCNLSNRNMAPGCYNGDDKLIDLVLSSFSTDNCLEFFGSLGLLTADEEGRIYPLTMEAATVRTLLLEECANLDIKIASRAGVEAVEPVKDGFRIRISNGEGGDVRTSRADVCILCTGGKASVRHGSGADGYRLLKMLGIHYEPIHPALVQIKTKESFVSSLKGLRCLASVSSELSGSEKGEILFTNYGLSGIPVLQLSGDLVQALSRGTEPVIHLDLCPVLSKKDIREHIVSRLSANPSLSAAETLYGLLDEKLASLITSDTKEPSLIAEKIKDFKLTAKDSNGFKNAQVTRGGVPSCELKENSLQSKNVPGLFICGELLNVDGLCGGYNLHFAWGSGILAAREAADFASHK